MSRTEKEGEGSERAGKHIPMPNSLLSDFGRRGRRKQLLQRTDEDDDKQSHNCAEVDDDGSGGNHVAVVAGVGTGGFDATTTISVLPSSPGLVLHWRRRGWQGFEVPLDTMFLVPGFTG